MEECGWSAPFCEMPVINYQVDVIVYAMLKKL